MFLIALNRYDCVTNGYKIKWYTIPGQCGEIYTSFLCPSSAICLEIKDSMALWDDWPISW